MEPLVAASKLTSTVSTPARVKRKKQWVRNLVKNFNRDTERIKFHADGSDLRIAWSVME